MMEGASTFPLETPQPRILDRWARSAFLRQLSALQDGEILLHDAVGHARLGQPGQLQASCEIHHLRFFRQAALGGSLAVGRSYLQGDWDCNDLTSLFRIFIRNMELADAMDSGWTRALQFGHRLVHRLRTNSVTGSSQNIEAHYDLGNEFFRLWLDESLAYSSGIFPTWTSSLHAASLEKFDRVCRKLELQPRDRLLEIGCGWGGLALHAAEHYGCHVTATTISRRQYELVAQRIAAAGLENRITLLLQDYRQLSGEFDKLASIEMIEAVGHEYLDTFFRKCGELLRPEGSLLLQAIVMPERRYEQYLRNVDFIQRFVFPGGCLPSTARMLEAAGRTTQLRLVNCEDFAPHYAETLHRWRDAFRSRLADVRALGYPDEFLRLWEYYLSYCQAVFEERYAGVVQIQFDGPRCRRDPLRIVARAANAETFADEHCRTASVDESTRQSYAPTSAGH